MARQNENAGGKLDSSFDKSKNDLISQLKEKRSKQAQDQDDENKIYMLMLDSKEVRQVDDVKAEALRSYSEECNHVNNGQHASNVDFTYVFIEKEIDRGGYGAVYKARSKGAKVEDDRLCIKMALHKTDYKSKKHREEGQDKVNKSLFREAANFNILKDNPHENIIEFRFYCVSTDFDEYMIGMEYFKGDNLSKTIEKYVISGKPMKTKMVKQIMRYSTEAVQHLQSLGIYHFDIKPHNILYNSDSEKLKFIDFGSAMQWEELKKEEEKMDHCCGAGTAEYIAPEVILSGYREVKPTSDIYSLGCLFYRLLTLERPWHHLEEIRQARDQKRNDKVMRLIRKRHEDYFALEVAESDTPYEPPNLPEMESTNESSPTEKLTELQKRIMDKTRQFYKDNSRECELIREMLRCDAARRPDCKKILAKLTEFSDAYGRQVSKLSHSSSSTGVPESPCSASLDIPVFNTAMDLGSGISTAALTSVIDRDKNLLLSQSTAIHESDEISNAPLEVEEDMDVDDNDKEGFLLDDGDQAMDEGVSSQESEVQEGGAGCPQEGGVVESLESGVGHSQDDGAAGSSLETESVDLLAHPNESADDIP